MAFRRFADLALGLGLAAASIPAAAPDSTALRDAQRALAQLSARHRASASFLLRFESSAIGADGEPLPKAKGSLLAADSGRFRLEHAQGTVVCDGRTLWQFFPARKQVIVKNADAVSAGAPGGVLLRFLEAKAVKAERTREGLRATLDPASVDENLDSLVLWLDPKTPAVRKVETQETSGARVAYTVKTLKEGAGARPKDFVFTPPAGVEVVDMR